jgi:Tfp pilus assembly major pilin PilA
MVALAVVAMLAEVAMPAVEEVPPEAASRRRKATRGHDEH